MNRAFYIVFYIIYLLLLAISLWFLLYYSGVHSWVFFGFFGIAILIATINLFIKEFLLKKGVTVDGEMIPNDMYTFWSWFYGITQITAIILVIVGIVFVIIHSTVPWWVWLILAVGIFMPLITAMLLNWIQGEPILSVLLSVISLTLVIIGLVFLVIYSEAPWWVWLLVGLTIIVAVVAGVLEGFSDKNQYVVDVEVNKAVLPRSHPISNNNAVDL